MFLLSLPTIMIFQMLFYLHHQIKNTTSRAKCFTSRAHIWVASMAVADSTHILK